MRLSAEHPVMAGLLVTFQFNYMTRSPLRVREGFLDRLIENVQHMGLPKSDETTLMALAIAGFGRRPEPRLRLCVEARAIIHDWAKAKALEDRA